MDMAAALSGIILLVLGFIFEELWMRLEPTKPPRPESLTNRFLEARWHYTCPCGKTRTTYDQHVQSYCCLSYRFTPIIHTIRRMLAYLGFADPQPDSDQNATLVVAITTDMAEKH